jgi:hypothetical protein
MFPISRHSSTMTTSCHGRFSAVLPLSLLAALLALAIPPLSAAESGRSIEKVLLELGGKMEQRLQPRFQFVDATWPPREVALVAFKDTRLLELWALEDAGWVFIKQYPIKGMSGHAGPKLSEGDLQVPEGFYRIEKMNPNSAYHLSMKLDYPNQFDRRMARSDGRRNLGDNIFIHGDRVSSGCLAIGDRAVEELFVLTAMLGMEHVSVIISPRDYRFRPTAEPAPGMPGWVGTLNEKIASNLQIFPLDRK